MTIARPDRDDVDRIPDEDLIEAFLNGHCAAYAIAAARALEAAGREDVGISILIDENGEPNSQDDRCVFHAYASCTDFDADARGVRTAGDMADDYDVGGVELDGPFSESDLLAFFCGEYGLEADPFWIAAADDLIARNPGLLQPNDQD
jgi:hypothetical protein